MTGVDGRTRTKGITHIDGQSGSLQPVGNGPSLEAVGPLSQSFHRVIRAVARTMQQVMAAARSDAEWSSHQLISTVIHEGPLRASALAELVQSDPSTISRQVASLIKEGFLERQIDPADGRASLLIATLRGRNLYDAQSLKRNARFQLLLKDWTDEECAQFQGYLDRLSAAFDERRPQLVADAARLAPVAETSRTDSRNNHNEPRAQEMENQ